MTLCSKKQSLVIPFLFSLFFSSISFSAQSANVSIRTGQYQQDLVLGNNKKTLSPHGYDLSLNFDLTDDININIDYGQQDNSSEFLTNSFLVYEQRSWGLGMSYYMHNWTFSGQYSRLNERVDVTNSRIKQNIYQEDYNSPIYAVSTSYNFDSSNDNLWLFNVAMTLQYNTWLLDITRVERPIADDNVTTGKNKGDALFGDVALSGSRIVDWFSDSDSSNNVILIGGSVSWNQLLSGEDSVVSRNGVSAQQIINRVSNSSNRINRSFFSQNIQGEKYGLVALFISYNLTENLSIDLEYSTSFSADENVDGSFINVNYSW